MQDLISIEYPEKWKDFFTSGDVQDELEFINQNMSHEGNIPSIENVFKSFEYECPENIKVIIFTDCPECRVLDDDSYKATGVGISLHPKDRDLTQEIVNIYGTLEEQYANFKKPTHGNFDMWCSQGVLLLNCNMSTPKGKRDVDNCLWISFINCVVKYLNTFGEKVYILMCNKDYKNILKPLIKKNPKNYVLETIGTLGTYYFKGNNVFIQCNQYLMSLGITPVDWCNL